MTTVSECPFCRSPASAMREGLNGSWRVYCHADGTCGDDAHDCGAQGPERDTEAEAIAAWNTRINASRPDGEGVGWCRQAAIYTDNEADNPLPERDPDGATIEHASWMLGEIINGDVSGRKAHRWLGYAQAILVMSGRVSLEEAKLCNKRASDEAAAQDKVEPAPPVEVADLCARLREQGWRVAVHNDYRLDGQDHTFWLWTRADGRFVKGEGRTDAEALAACVEAVTAIERLSVSSMGSGYASLCAQLRHVLEDPSLDYEVRIKRAKCAIENALAKPDSRRGSL